MNTLLAGKNALVTGGTRGIGLAVAEALLAAGAGVAICGRSEESVKNAVSHLTNKSKSLTNKSKSKVVGKVADVRSNTEVADLFSWIDHEMPDLDVLVNNAGVGVFKSAAELSVEDWQKTLETNLSG